MSYSINPFNPPPILWTCYLVIPDCCGEGTLESLCCPQGRKLQWSSIKFGSHSAPLDQACLSQTQPVAIMSGQIITDIQNVNFKLILCLAMLPLQHPDKGCIFKRERKTSTHHIGSFIHLCMSGFQFSTPNWELSHMIGTHCATEQLGFLPLESVKERLLGAFLSRVALVKYKILCKHQRFSF